MPSTSKVIQLSTLLKRARKEQTANSTVIIKKIPCKNIKGQSASVTAYLRSAESVLKEWHTANISAHSLLRWFNVFLLIAHFVATEHAASRDW